jgi:hypothetical protein
MNRRLASLLLSVSLLLVADAAHALCGRSAGTPDDGTTACDAQNPICVQGTCIGCRADFGSMRLYECPTSAAPYCTSLNEDAGVFVADGGSSPAGGQCGSCKNAGASACTGHAGPVCTSSGGCGLGCARDTDCKSTEFCDPLSLGCAAKLADGTRLPTGDTCDSVTAKRECKSGVCDPATSLCGPVKPPSASDGGVEAGAPTAHGDAGADTVIAMFTTEGGCSAGGGALPPSGAVLVGAALLFVRSRRRGSRR